MKREGFAALIFVLSSLGAIGVSGFTRSSLPIPKDAGKIIGEIIFLLGMIVFVWAAIYLREAFRGTVAPILDRLVQNGPYRWVRHPLYLSMFITLIGIAMAFGSLWGLIATFVLFAPAMVYRARLEEQALSAKFGCIWDEYVSRTHFIIPLLW